MKRHQLDQICRAAAFGPQQLAKCPESEPVLSLGIGRRRAILVEPDLSRAKQEAAIPQSWRKAVGGGEVLVADHPRISFGLPIVSSLISAIPLSGVRARRGPAPSTRRVRNP